VELVHELAPTVVVVVMGIVFVKQDPTHETNVEDKKARAPFASVEEEDLDMFTHLPLFDVFETEPDVRVVM
jgi:hypothetical protein